MATPSKDFSTEIEENISKGYNLRNKELGNKESEHPNLNDEGKWLKSSNVMVNSAFDRELQLDNTNNNVGIKELLGDNSALNLDSDALGIDLALANPDKIEEINRRSIRFTHSFLMCCVVAMMLIIILLGNAKEHLADENLALKANLKIMENINLVSHGQFQARLQMIEKENLQLKSQLEARYEPSYMENLLDLINFNWEKLSERSERAKINLLPWLEKKIWN